MAWKFVAVAALLAVMSFGAYTFWPESSSTDGTNTSTNTVVRENASTNSTTSAGSGKISKFATMLAFQSGQGFAGDKALEEIAWTGWANLRNGSSWNTYYSNLTKSFERNVDLVAETDFASNRDVVGAFAWNVIQPTKGAEYDWTMPDLVLSYAGEAEVTISAVVYPYGSWQTEETTAGGMCAGIDFAFFDSHLGYPKDMEAYEAFLTAMVERYDGDGRDDMPGLTTRVEAWEIGNEVEGPCARSDAEEYLEFLEASYEIIKVADQNAIVVNAGALEAIANTGRIQDTIDFWEEFFALGGADTVDVFSVHYNAERSKVKSTPDAYEENLAFFRDLLDSHDASDVPMWLGEFGVPTSEAYETYVEIGDSLGVERYFIDLSGGDEGVIGPAALFKPTGQAREFLTTLQELGAL